MGDVCPWILHEQPKSLNGKRRTSDVEDYDYSASMTQGPGPGGLRGVVVDVLSKTYPGRLLSAEFRLRDWRSLKDSYDCSVDDVVPEVPELEEERPRSQVKLARLLRPDQEAALDFLLESEAISKAQDCHFKAFVRMKPKISVGWYARLRHEFPLNNLRSELFKLNCGNVLKVLTTPGLVTEVEDPEREGMARVTLVWDLSSGAFSLNVERSRLEIAFKTLGGIRLGGAVRLLRRDAANFIDTTDVGVVTRLDDAGVNLEVCFPQCLCWKGACGMVVPANEDLKYTCAELRLSVRYELRGSICAQKMGWGKTPLMVALMKKQWEEAGAAASSSTESPQRSTSLVVVPPKIFRQWVNELRTWLGAPQGRMRTPWGASWILTADGMTVWAPVDMAAFKERPAEQVLFRV